MTTRTRQTTVSKDCCSGAGKEDMGLPGKGQSGARSCLRAERLPQNMEFRVQGHVAVLVHKLDAELGVLSKVVALNGVACSRLWIELHATEQQTGS